jgi:hypothetical protein
MPFQSKRWVSDVFFIGVLLWVFDMAIEGQGGETGRVTPIGGNGQHGSARAAR